MDDERCRYEVTPICTRVVTMVHLNFTSKKLFEQHTRDGLQSKISFISRLVVWDFV